MGESAAPADADFGTYALSPFRQAVLRRIQRLPANEITRRVCLYTRKLLRIGIGRVVDAEVEGLKLRLFIDDNICERKILFMPQFFDVPERELIREKLPEDGVFLDVGANAGLYSLWAAAGLDGEKGGRVLAVEPNPIMTARMKRNIKLNGFEDRVTLVEKGVAEAKGSFAFTPDRSNHGGGGIQADREVGSEATEAGTFTIECEPLWDMVQGAKLKRVDILKIDIEGAEDRVLIPYLDKAPAELLPRYIITEDSNHVWSEDLPAALARKGYEKLLEKRANTIYERKDKSKRRRAKAA
jgi:FkbM family methyltransferase